MTASISDTSWQKFQVCPFNRKPKVNEYYNQTKLLYFHTNHCARMLIGNLLNDLDYTFINTAATMG